jgi:hypothetical protein
MGTDNDKYTTRLTLGEFRRLTAHLPDNTILIERAHSEARAVMVSDINVDECVGDVADPEAMDAMDVTWDDLGLGEGAMPDTPVVVLAAWD